MSTLTQVLSSKVKAEVFRLLFGMHDRPLHLREMERQSGLAVSTVRQELKRLADLGLITERADGNRTYYSANKKHPIYPDIRSIVLKTSGLAETLHEALKDLDLRVAFVFGSIARGDENAESDLDLIAIGTLSLREAAKRLRSLTESIGREINPHVMSEAEFARRKASHDHFISTVLAEPRIFVIGDEHELDAMGK